MNVPMHPSAEADLEHMAALEETTPIEIIHRALSLYKVWTEMAVNEELAIHNMDTGEIWKIKLDYMGGMPS